MASEASHPVKVSILIVNYNGEAFLRACLESLHRVKQPSFEVVVVDNASRDQSLAILKEFPWVKCVESKVNTGFAGGNNLGMSHCRGQFILLLNSDTVVTPDFLQVMCDHMENHPEAGVVQPRMILPNRGGTMDSCGSFMTRFGFMYHYGFLKPDHPKYHVSYRPFSAKGACMLLRREAVERAGGYLFDEDFFCYYEDTDLCHRVWIGGFEVHYVGSVAIQHLMGATSETAHATGFVMDNFLRNQLFSLTGNLQWNSILMIMPLYLGAFMANCAGSLLRGNWILCRSHLRALWFVISHPGKLARHRRLIRQTRRWSDQEIFRKTLRHPNWRYFYCTFKGPTRIGEFVDEPLPDSITL